MGHVQANEIAFTFGFGLTNDLSKYSRVPCIIELLALVFLVLPLTSYSKAQFWESFLFDSCRSLDSLQGSHFSGSVLSNANLLPPIKVCDSIDQICRSFLWGESVGKRKLRLVPWNQVCQNKQLGGLSLRHARNVNLAFMRKLGSGLIHKRDELWVQVLQSRYN